MIAAQSLLTLCPLFEYPSADFITAAVRCETGVRTVDPGAAAALRAFIAEVRSLPLAEREELFIKTFDMNVRCTLDLGWQLFGEDYNRGLFLAKVRTLLAQYGIEETHELPDHVSQVLRLLAHMPRDEAAHFAGACVLPALQKSLAAIDEGNPYKRLLEAAVRLLAKIHAIETEEITDGAHIQHV